MPRKPEVERGRTERRWIESGFEGSSGVDGEVEEKEERVLGVLRSRPSREVLGERGTFLVPGKRSSRGVLGR